MAAITAAVGVVLLLQGACGGIFGDYYILNIVIPTLKVGVANRYYARHQNFCLQSSWTSCFDDMSDKQFCRYFCMSKKNFKRLCDLIIKNVGEAEFKSEASLEENI